MADLKTKYMGLELRNPIIVGSSGLTHSLKNIREIDNNGAGAVVLKSLFEEQIMHEINKSFKQMDTAYAYPEAQDYISNYSRENRIDEYLALISDSKKTVNIPIIASINCVSASEWTAFAKRIEEAGADALELNVFVLPSNPDKNGTDNEQVYFDIIEKVKEVVSIPISLKISYYFSGLAETIKKLSWTGIKGIVLFNRFFSPDIDINAFKVTSSHVFSHPEEISLSLRWIAMLRETVQCDLAASTGIHNGEAIIKQLLAGANAVQIASILYKNGFSVIGEMLQDIEKWMKLHNFEYLNDFRSKMSLKNTENPASYERVQFMKHFAGIE